MTGEKRKAVLALIARYLVPRWHGSVTDWVCANVLFDEPDNHGPFSTAGRDYVREPLDAFSDNSIHDEVLVFGSQTGKTAMLMGGIAWQLVNDPSRVLWVMPSIDLATAFSETRWMPLLRSTRQTRELIPTGQARYGFKKAQQTMKGGIVSFVGSNSPGNISSHPVRTLICDEVDKFDSGTRGEADAVNLAEQRTKSFALPKRIKTSTPTMIDGIIWQEYLKGDQRRYFMPCPECGKHVLFAWSKKFTILPLLGCEAFVHWDREAKGSNGWDLARVEKSAHALCPHCGHRIRDEQKTAMLRAGEWRPTSSSAPAFRSRQLSSLYACSAQTTFGKLAVKFLQAKRSFLGLQGFINGDLAEPFESQDAISERVELTASATPLEGAVSLMTVDCQAVSPYFWYVVRSWAQDGNSRLIAQGNADDWEAVRAVQQQHAVADNHVLIDSGYNTADVYKNCLRWGKIAAQQNGVAVHIGWMPAKGREKEARWLDPKTKQPKPWMLGSAALPDTKVRLPLLEFGSDHLLGLLSKLRKGQDECGGLRWEVTDAADQEYWRHMDSKIEKEFTSGRTGKIVHVWSKRSKRWPDHLLDCEVMQVAMAMLHRRLPWAREAMKRNG